MKKFLLASSAFLLFNASALALVTHSVTVTNKCDVPINLAARKVWKNNGMGFFVCQKKTLQPGASTTLTCKTNKRKKGLYLAYPGRTYRIYFYNNSGTFSHHSPIYSGTNNKLTIPTDYRGKQCEYWERNPPK